MVLEICESSLYYTCVTLHSFRWKCALYSELYHVIVCIYCVFMSQLQTENVTRNVISYCQFCIFGVYWKELSCVHVSRLCCYVTNANVLSECCQCSCSSSYRVTTVFSSAAVCWRWQWDGTTAVGWTETNWTAAHTPDWVHSRRTVRIVSSEKLYICWSCLKI